MIIQKPMLASNFNPESARFPYIATPKIDGIRFLMVNGVALSRTFKPIRNRHIQSLLSKFLPDGIDGELTCGANFQSSTSAIMSIEGEPNFKVWIFDYLNPSLEEILPFYNRILSLPYLSNLPFEYEVLSGHIVNNAQELEHFETICLEQGCEGVMLRDPQGTYKFGRATPRENLLLKVKRFADDEATIIGFLEKESNQNEAQKDAFGYTKRSSSQSGKVLAGTLGAFLVKDAHGNTFSIGSGLNDTQRQEIWHNQEQYLGKLVKYKYFPHGIKEKPRHPIFIGFRDPDDM